MTDTEHVIQHVSTSSQPSNHVIHVYSRLTQHKIKMEYNKLNLLLQDEAFILTATVVSVGLSTIISSTHMATNALLLLVEWRRGRWQQNCDLTIQFSGL